MPQCRQLLAFKVGRFAISFATGLSSTCAITEGGETGTSAAADASKIAPCLKDWSSCLDAVLGELMTSTQPLTLQCPAPLKHQIVQYLASAIVCKSATRSPAASPKRRRAAARSDSIPQLPPHTQAWLWSDSHRRPLQASLDLSKKVCKCLQVEGLRLPSFGDGHGGPSAIMPMCEVHKCCKSSGEALQRASCCGLRKPAEGEAPGTATSPWMFFFWVAGSFFPGQGATSRQQMVSAKALLMAQPEDDPMGQK